MAIAFDYEPQPILDRNPGSQGIRNGGRTKETVPDAKGNGADRGDLPHDPSHGQENPPERWRDLKDLAQSESIEVLRDLIPAALAGRYKVVPLGFYEDRLQIAVAEPDDVSLLDELRWILGVEVEPRRASSDEIDEALRLIYGLGAEAVGHMLEEDGGGGSYVELVATSDLDDDENEASIVRFVNELLINAFRERATDIHIEPFESSLRIRYRIDGILYEIPVPESLQCLHRAIVSRIKIMANLNIAEQRLPQDGRIKVLAGRHRLDLRISILPTPFGESVTLRILNSNEITLGLEHLGLLPRDLALIERLLRKPHGIVLVTGPTGSGKTTSLYACLNRLNDTCRKIITVEDPIEYQLPGITQMQVKPKIGLTFAQGLRSMLRHDPDIILVGEIRDHETAEVTIQVAMTGHLVFSTLHTNDAPSAVARLTNMGIEPYLIAASVECIIAQRLVRRICPNCKYVDSRPEGRHGLPHEQFGKDCVCHRGQGCPACKQTGYRGRTAIYEFLMVDDEIREHIAAKTSAGRLRQLAMAKGMIGLRQDGFQKVAMGITTLDEVLRVTQELGD